MDINTFYSLVSGTCFALVGLWWNAVSMHPEWLKDEKLRNLAGGIYLSFLIPATMSLGAQIGGDNKIIWRAVFIVAALLGGFFTTRLIIKTSGEPNAGFFRKNRWLVVLLYAIILVYAIVPELGQFVGLTGLQVEAFLICFLILLGHGLTWEFMTESKN